MPGFFAWNLLNNSPTFPAPKRRASTLNQGAWTTLLHLRDAAAKVLLDIPIGQPLSRLKACPEIPVLSSLKADFRSGDDARFSYCVSKNTAMELYAAVPPTSKKKRMPKKFLPPATDADHKAPSPEPGAGNPDGAGGSGSDQAHDGSSQGTRMILLARVELVELQGPPIMARLRDLKSPGLLSLQQMKQTGRRLWRVSRHSVSMSCRGGNKKKTLSRSSALEHLPRVQPFTTYSVEPPVCPPLLCRPPRLGASATGRFGTLASENHQLPQSKPELTELKKSAQAGAEDEYDEYEMLCRMLIHGGITIRIASPAVMTAFIDARLAATR